MLNEKKNPELMEFVNPEFGKIRSITIENQPFFLGKDVAKILEYKNTTKAIRDHVDDEDKTANESFSVNGTMGVLINESGLYSLILRSQLPKARQFKRWVTSEVLPSIRRNGVYMTEKTIEKALADPDFLIQLATNLKNEKTKNAELTQKVEGLTAVNKALSEKSLTYSDSNVLNALIRKYASVHCHNNFALAWNSFYKVLYYDKHINLRARNAAGKSLLEKLKVSEYADAVEVATAMCVKNDIDVEEILQHYNNCEN